MWKLESAPAPSMTYWLIVSNMPVALRWL